MCTATETVAVCTPINVLIAPASNAYEVVVEAEAPVREGLAIDVNGKGLGIASNLTFNSSQPIKVTVRMPQGATSSSWKQMPSFQRRQ